jgi:hypothetical protein
VVKRCLYCGKYFRVDPRVGERQKACHRAGCKRARKRQAQKKWRSNNPDYYKNHYIDYVKEWRRKKRQEMIKDKIPPSKPMQELLLLIPEDKKGMIKDEIILRRIARYTFAAYG